MNMRQLTDHEKHCLIDLNLMILLVFKQRWMQHYGTLSS